MSVLATICLLLLGACMIPCLYRVAVGPHALDRVLAFDLIAVLLVAMLAIFAYLRGSWAYLEIAMGVAVLAFVGTIAAARFIERGRIV